MESFKRWILVIFNCISQYFTQQKNIKLGFLRMEKKYLTARLVSVKSKISDKVLWQVQLFFSLCNVEAMVFLTVSMPLKKQ